MGIHAIAGTNAIGLSTCARPTRHGKGKAHDRARGRGTCAELVEAWRIMTRRVAAVALSLSKGHCGYAELCAVPRPGLMHTKPSVGSALQR